MAEEREAGVGARSLNDGSPAAGSPLPSPAVGLPTRQPRHSRKTDREQ